MKVRPIDTVEEPRMADIKERQTEGSPSSQAPVNTRLKDLQQRIFKRGVEKSEIPAAAVDYRPTQAPAEVRFVRQKLPCHSPSRLFEQEGLQPAPLWIFIDQIPVKLDSAARHIFKQKFGNDPAFVFAGADGFLWVWHPTLAGCRIDRFPMRKDIDNVWLVGYKSV